MIGFLSEIRPKKKIIGIGGNIRSFLGVATKKELSINEMNAHPGWGHGWATAFLRDPWLLPLASWILDSWMHGSAQLTR